MPPLRKQMIDARQRSGKGERTQQAYVRAVRRLSPFSRPSPGRIAEPALQHYLLHRKNVDPLAPASMRICYSALRFFSMSSNAMGLPSPSCAPQLPTASPPASVLRRAGGSGRSPPLYNITSTSPPSTVWDYACMQLSPFRSPISPLIACWFMAIAGRAPKTATSLCPKSPWRCYAPLGHPTAISPGSFLPLGAINNNTLTPFFPCVDIVSRVPAAQPNNAQGFPQPVGPSLPADIPPPPICSQPACTSAASNSPLAPADSPPPWSPGISPNKAPKRPPSGAMLSCQASCQAPPA
jgi:hypothetical protein